MFSMWSARACGKLYLAGEYAVVFGGHAVLAPVKKYLTVHIERSDAFRIRRLNYDEGYIPLDIYRPTHEYRYVAQTLCWFQSYLSEQGREIQPYQIEIETELENQENNKYGFGSSAAVVIALLRALNMAYECNLDCWQQYKAGVLISSKISLESSFGDLACIAFEKVIEYKKFDFDLEMYQGVFLKQKLLEMDWSGLIIQGLTFQEPFLIVHTKQTASSSQLVSMVRKHADSQEFKDFLKISDKLVEAMVRQTCPLRKIIQALNQNLRNLAEFTKTPLFTPQMKEIEDVANNQRGVMKFSGAGGGDCVLCFFEDLKDLNLVYLKLMDNEYESIVYREDYHES